MKIRDKTNLERILNLEFNKKKSFKIIKKLEKRIFKFRF